MKKIFVIVGTRPEAIKLFPVFKALKSFRHFETTLIMTGQHGSGMMDPLVDFFGVEVDMALKIPNPSINQFGASLIAALDKVLSESQPEMVVVQGDTTSSMMASLAAFNRRVKIAHVEAGLRTYLRTSPFPEEANRRITSVIADIHFCPTETAKSNLIKENVEGRIEVVGNTVIDSLLDACARIKADKDRYREKFSYLRDRFEKIVVVTVHRRENIGERFLEICAAVNALAVENDRLAFVYPLHVNPAVRNGAIKNLQGVPNIFLIEPLPYDEMVFLMGECYLMITDSGGLQEECPTLNKPVLVLRDTTERPEGIEAGCSILAGVSASEIVSSFNQVLYDEAVYTKMATSRNPFGDGNSSIRIASAIDDYLTKIRP